MPALWTALGNVGRWVSTLADRRLAAHGRLRTIVDEVRDAFGAPGRRPSGDVRVPRDDADALRMMLARAVYQDTDQATAADLLAGRAILRRLEAVLDGPGGLVVGRAQESAFPNSCDASHE